MNFDSEDEDLLLSILILKRRIRRPILRKKKKKQSIWLKHISCYRATAWNTKYFNIGGTNLTKINFANINAKNKFIDTLK